MLRMILYHLLLFGSCGYALRRGSRDARIVAATCLIATFASVPIAAYGAVELNVVFVDLLVLIAFLYVALQTDRFWPLWIAGLHVTTMVGHALMLLTGDMVPIAYAVALRLWAYPELIILALAVWRHDQRLQAPVPAPQPS